MFRRTRRTLCSVAAAAALAAAGLAAPQAQAVPVRIYPLGDSITYGATYTLARPAQLPPEVPLARSTPVNTPGGYRQPLTLALTAGGLEHQFVGAWNANSSPLLDQLGQNRHDGHPGYRIEQDAKALDGFSGAGSDNGGHWLTGTANRAPIFPDVTLIHLGTNDIYQRFDPTPGVTYTGAGGKVDIAKPAERAVFVRNMTARLGALVDKVQALRPGSRIVLSNVLPLAIANFDLLTYEYAAAIQQLVAAEQATGAAKVVYADVWSKFAAVAPTGAVVVVPGLLSPDNAHPTPAGYAVMAAVYRDAVLAALA